MGGITAGGGVGVGRRVGPYLNPTHSITPSLPVLSSIRNRATLSVRIVGSTGPTPNPPPHHHPDPAHIDLGAERYPLRGVSYEWDTGHSGSILAQRALPYPAYPLS